jgi:hypothetical protein
VESCKTISMAQSRLRLIVFCMWIAFSFVVTAVVCVAPIVRNRGGKPVLDSGLVIPALRSVSGIWLPGVSCLAAFWFPKRERRGAKTRTVPEERYYSAILLTAGYLLASTLAVVWIAWIVRYPDVSPELSEGTSFLERLHDVVSYCLLLSPIALAPVHWLTGGF